MTSIVDKAVSKAVGTGGTSFRNNITHIEPSLPGTPTQMSLEDEGVQSDGNGGGGGGGGEAAKLDDPQAPSKQDSSFKSKGGDSIGMHSKRSKGSAESFVMRRRSSLIKPQTEPGGRRKSGPRGSMASETGTSG